AAEPSAGRPKVARNAWFTCVVVSAILAPSIEKFEKSNFQTFFWQFFSIFTIKITNFSQSNEKNFFIRIFLPLLPLTLYFSPFSYI
ncbi:hypothetical protein, partial [Campylobacter sp.]|uniref:hypothetical protein n=1 Tax=Campylobacter sp. TaxID=205 RepID=UPI002AA8D23B